MPIIKKVLCTAAISEENKKRLCTALGEAEVIFVPSSAKKRIAEAGADVDAAIFEGNLDKSVLASPNLKWIHCCCAGVENSAIPEVFERNIVLTSSAGRSASALAEHALLFIMALTYDLPGLGRAQAEHKWSTGQGDSGRTGLYGKTVGIIGLGNTGREVARLCKGFRMTVLGWRRSRRPVPNVDQVFASNAGEGIDEILHRSDYVVLCAELNNDTWHLMGSREFAQMKKSAYLVNVGRGSLIDESAMTDALKNGIIAGAGLDTFETEPLPERSSLWDLPNVMITPHVTPMLPDREERMLAYVFENIKAYLESGAFVNRVMPCSMLTKNQHLQQAPEAVRT